MAKPKREPRVIAWVSETTYVKDQGYRVSFVVEGEDGHRPTGDWPYRGKPGQTVPWFWGPTLEDARRACDEYNGRLGVSREEAFKIVSGSIEAGIARTKRRAETEPRRNKKRTLEQALMELHEGSQAVEGAEFYVAREKSRGRGAPIDMYLSGVPYLWTTFSERAFVFGSRRSAEELIAAYPKELDGARVEEREQLLEEKR